ncbi:MAG: hypothetical protein N2557_07900 [Hydrogenophilus sp.]|nr:hypothetical protein [Hydrogenophilus sp.]
MTKIELAEMVIGPMARERGGPLLVIYACLRELLREEDPRMRGKLIGLAHEQAEELPDALRELVMDLFRQAVYEDLTRRYAGAED